MKVRPRTIQSLASLLLGLAVLGILALGEARVAAAPSLASSDAHSAILDVGPTIAAAPTRPTPPDVLLLVTVVAAAAYLAPWPTLLVPARLAPAPQPQAPLYLRELVLLL